MDRLPLGSVRTFGVVARLLSITRAAEELNVTPSAVSHQIRVLEEYLSTSLFRRERNKITLTPAGEQYLSQVSESLALLARATESIKGAKGAPVLRIAAPPSLAYLWLIERLPRFMKAHPDIAVAVTAMADLPPLLQGLFDAGFWYGHGKLPGLHAEPLVGNYAFPICNPSFLKGDHALKSPADLARCTLLESTDEAYYQYKEPRQPVWAEWLRTAGFPELTGVRSLNFTPRLMVHRAVTAGAGVGLSRTLLAIDAIEAKEVAVPFGPALPQTATYHLLHATNLGRRRDVAAFRNWVLSEAEASARKVTRLLRRMASK